MSVHRVGRDPQCSRDGFFLLNASARLYTNDGRWELAVIGRNLANTFYEAGLVTALGSGADPTQLAATNADPRQILLQLTYHFH